MTSRVPKPAASKKVDESGGKKPEHVKPRAAKGRLTDCLARCYITKPKQWRPVERALVTVTSPGYAEQADEMLTSAAAYGCVPDAARVIYAVDPDDEQRSLARKHGATLVECEAQGRIDSQIKAVTYSAHLATPAHRYVVIDGDCVVLDSLEPLYAALEALPAGRVLAARDGLLAKNAWPDLGAMLVGSYVGTVDEVREMGADPKLLSYPLCINDGVYAADYDALASLDKLIRSWRAHVWADGHATNTWRNQFVFNLACAAEDRLVELDASWNAQRYFDPITFTTTGGRLRGEMRGAPVRIAHFCAGSSRHHVKDGWWRRLSKTPPRPVVRDGYCEFLCALNEWVAWHGEDALAWSFYGTQDGRGGVASKSGGYPAFEAVYALLRAEGVARVVETGTARGVSTALLACAVAGRPGAQVLTIDPAMRPDRNDLWGLLPDLASRAIMPLAARAEDVLSNLDVAPFDAALIDSLHTREQVLFEFVELRRVVKPGGLILIHDPLLRTATVGEAVKVISEAYPCVVLPQADGDGLGLAVVTNKEKP